jgi:hypothetical protein
MNTDAKQRDGNGAQHSEADSGKGIPSQIYGAKANGDCPDQGSGLKRE